MKRDSTTVMTLGSGLIRRGNGGEVRKVTYASRTTATVAKVSAWYDRAGTWMTSESWLEDTLGDVELGRAYHGENQRHYMQDRHHTTKQH